MAPTKRNISVFFFILALLISALALELAIVAVADPYIAPEESPLGYRIYGNGTYDAPNLHRDGNVYTFTSDIEGTIVIERDGVVLDGSGYTLQGKGDSIGVWLQDRTGVAIKNLNIQNFEHGIRFTHYLPNWHSGQTNPSRTTNCTIQACNITNNYYGISLYSCFNCTLLENYIANSTYGVYLYGADNTFRNNRIEQNKYNFWDIDEYVNYVDTSNTINGKPIYYLVDQQNMTVPKNAGLVILKRCSGIKVQNLNLTGQGSGLSLYYTNNSIIAGNKISDNYWRGIAIWWSNNNTIIGNQIANTTGDGIEEYESSNNAFSHNLITTNAIGIYHRTPSFHDVISDNQIVANQNGGIYGASTNCTVTNNYIFGNSGVGISVGNNSVINGNNITQNSGDGIWFGSNNSITNNSISKNNNGLVTPRGSYNTISSNEIVLNVGGALCLGSGGTEWEDAPRYNLIYSNNFIDNNQGGAQVIIRNITILGIPFREEPGFANSWSKGAEGNYWSDYNGSGPYYINENNQDYHPLLEPLEFHSLGMPSIEPPRETEADNTQTPTGSTDIPIWQIAAAIFVISVAIASLSLLFFFKKRKH